MLINGDLSIDERGVVKFVNEFNFRDVKRFYIVENHGDLTRGWHGHEKEAKYVFVSKGRAKVEVKPLKVGETKSYMLSEKKPQVLYIPAGNYNAVTTYGDTQVIFFSTSTLEESKSDDIREEYVNSGQ